MKKISSICIIDDDPITVFGIQHQILHAEASRSLLVHYNGKDALESFKYSLSQSLPIPQIILLDINMPIMDGWQFLEAFLELPVKQNIDIYILTSSISEEDKRKSEQFKKRSPHRLEYLIKPFNQKQLLAIVQHAAVKSS
ncbi:MAG: response regulator [Flavobacteriaceae bacterium]|nr:response regulator [Flavobacteriaceae bacterium]